MKICLGRSVLAYFAYIFEYLWSKMDAENICIAMETYRLSWRPISHHSNQKILLRIRANLGFIVFLTNNEYCDSATTPLTRAPREGQGPSSKSLRIDWTIADN